jgi:hypothetical protein
MPASKVRGTPNVAPDVPLGRQIRDAEKEMMRLERRRSSLTEKIVASSDHGEQSKLGSELADLLSDLNEAEDRWLGLVE